MRATHHFLRSLSILSLAICAFTIAPGARAQQVISGIQVFPSNNVWNTRIDSLPVDANSTSYVNALGPSNHMHPDFDYNQADGIPYNLVTKPLTTSPKFLYLPDSDLGPYPTVSTALAIEGSSWSTGSNGGDRHVLQIDTNNGILYELYDATIHGSTVSAGSGAIFPFNSNMLRPDTYTSADAAGLPIFPGLVNYPEAYAGRIKHAFRFTGAVVNGYIWPARHLAGSQTPGAPPFGQRFRLKATYTIPSGSSRVVQNVLTAMQQYGIIYADLGSDWYVSGSYDSNWNDTDLDVFKSLVGSDFEAVDESSLMVRSRFGCHDLDHAPLSPFCPSRRSPQKLLRARRPRPPGEKLKSLDIFMKHKTTKKKAAGRKAYGNMLLLCMAMLGIVVVVVSLGFGVYFLFTPRRCFSIAAKALP